MITKEQFQCLWSKFWKAFPNVRPEQAERIGPFYYEELHEFEYSTIETVFTWLRKKFTPTFNEPLPSIATVEQRIADMFSEIERKRNRQIQEEDKLLNLPTKEYYDNLAKNGIKIGPYKGKSGKEIKSIGQILYDEHIENIRNQHRENVNAKHSN